MSPSSFAGQLGALLVAQPRHSKFDAKSAAALISEFLELVARHALTGTPVEVAGFGTFRRSTTKARTLRNPITGELMRVGPTWRLGFRPARAKKGSGR